MFVCLVFTFVCKRGSKWLFKSYAMAGSISVCGCFGFKNVCTTCMPGAREDFTYLGTGHSSELSCGAGNQAWVLWISLAIEPFLQPSEVEILRSSEA